MSEMLILLRPSSNRVYSAEAADLSAAELEILSGLPAEVVTVAGVDYLAIPRPASGSTDGLGALSAFFAAYEREGTELLRPVPVERPDRFADDLVGIPKYAGKTNEQFTRLLLNVTLAARDRPDPGTPRSPLTVLDPMCGRGTTLSTALTLGHHGAGVEVDVAAVDAYATFLRTYLRRKRLKHSVEVNPLRREGRTLGKRLEVEVSAPYGADDAGSALRLGVLTGDTRQSAALWGRRRFDAVVTDAPYGIVHGSQEGPGRTRSAAELLTEAIPVWAGQLKHGGALGLAWNTYSVDRDTLESVARAAGLEPLDTGPHRRLGHRVDSSIHRDVLVARKP